MTRNEALRMEAQILSEPGWHAEMIGPNTWTGEYTVEAWQGDGATDSEDRENSYHLRFLADWYRLREGLRQEREDALLHDLTTRFLKQGYSQQRAAELAVWELHVRTGGD